MKKNRFMFGLLAAAAIIVLVSACEQLADTAPKSGEKAITTFSIQGVSGTIDGTNISVSLPHGTDRTGLAPLIGVSEKARVDPASGVARDFSGPVTYTVTAEDGTTRVYTVTVTLLEPEPEPEPEKQALAGTIAITGEAKVDQILTVNEDGLTNKSGTPSYQWMRGGETIGDNQASYQVSAADLGSQITVIVSYSGNLGSVTSAPTAAVVAADVEKQALAGSVTIDGTAKVGEQLTVNESGLTNKSGTAIYQWKRGADNVGANQNSYQIAAGDLGATITVIVSYSGNTGSITSAPTAAVIAAEIEKQALAGSVTIDGTARVGEQLTVNESGLTTKSGTPSYQWKRGADNIGTNAKTYTLTLADAGAAITVIVSYSGNTGSITSAPTAAVVKQALAGMVQITGTAKVGMVLTADIGGLTNLTGTPAYQWKRNGANIGTNVATYLVDLADFGAQIAVVVSSSGNAGNITSAATSAIEKQALAGTISINGNAIVGHQLTVNDGGLTNKIGSPSYQWQRGGGNIAGATTASYTLVQDDAGHAMTVVVSYSGNAGSVTSAATSAVVKQALAGMIQIVGTAKVGQNLTINESGLTNKSGTASYQWKRDAGNISGATAASYTLVQDDAGHAITVVVSYSGNTGSITSAATGAVQLRELGGTVSINGDARVGGQLTVNESGLLYKSGTPTYQWKKNETNIGTNSTTYLIAMADLGATITVVVSYSGNAGNVTSAATSAVVKQQLTGSISITGDAKKGNVLTAIISGGNGTGTPSYQWMRGTNDITGANNATYTLVANDVGHAIKVRASYANQDGSITSNPTAMVDINREFTLTAFSRQITLTDGRAGAMDDLNELGVKGNLQTALNGMAGDSDISDVLDRGITFVVMEDDSLDDYYVVVDNRTMHIEYYYALNPNATVIRNLMMNIMYSWTAKANSAHDAIRLANAPKRIAPVIDIASVTNPKQQQQSWLHGQSVVTRCVHTACVALDMRRANSGERRGVSHLVRG